MLAGTVELYPYLLYWYPASVVDTEKDRYIHDFPPFSIRRESPIPSRE
jgi:hypothetical protein